MEKNEKIVVNGQVFESQEDYEKNYVVQSMDIEGLGTRDAARPSQVEDKDDKKKPKLNADNILNKQQTWWAIGGALRAAFFVYGTVALGALIFVLFCVFVWFR